MYKKKCSYITWRTTMQYQNRWNGQCLKSISIGHTWMPSFIKFLPNQKFLKIVVESASSGFVGFAFFQNCIIFHIIWLWIWLDLLKMYLFFKHFFIIKKIWKVWLWLLFLFLHKLLCNLTLCLTGFARNQEFSKIVTLRAISDPKSNKKYFDYCRCCFFHNLCTFLCKLACLNVFAQIQGFSKMVP